MSESAREPGGQLVGIVATLVIDEPYELIVDGALRIPTVVTAARIIDTIQYLVLAVQPNADARVSSIVAALASARIGSEDLFAASVGATVVVHGSLYEDLELTRRGSGYIGRLQLVGSDEC